MVAFTFVVKKEGKSWHAARVAAETEEEGEAIEATADDTYRCGRLVLLHLIASALLSGQSFIQIADLCCQAVVLTADLHPSSLQKELYNKALEQANGAVRTSFSVVSPKSAVYQVGDLSSPKGRAPPCSSAWPAQMLAL